MEGDGRAIVGINTGRSDNRTTKISADVFGSNGDITIYRFSVNIKTVLVFVVAFSAGCFERRTNSLTKKF